MTKTRISVDRALLASAMEFFDTASKSVAVNESLALVVRSAAFEREVELAKAGGYDALVDSEDNPE